MGEHLVCNQGVGSSILPRSTTPSSRLGRASVGSNGLEKMDSPAGEILSVRSLTVCYEAAGANPVHAVEDATFAIRPAEVVGVLGESGCGKTTLAHSLLKLLPASARILGGSIRYQGIDLLGLGERELREIRGAEISLIPQEPGIALCPVIPVGEQVAEVIRAHRPWPRERCRTEAMALLELVRLSDVARQFKSYPHQLSGGELQRVAIAQAVACRPQLIIADEPTTALDATVEAGILALLKDLQASEKTSFLFISHNPAVLREVAGRILVMYAGQIVEEGAADEVLGRPEHPYTQALLKCAPRKGDETSPSSRGPLFSIPGEPPLLSGDPSSCLFEPRCEQRMTECRERSPDVYRTGATRKVRCLKYHEGGPSTDRSH
jgi:peptide/nickel transport system ATP-binding protein